MQANVAAAINRGIIERSLWLGGHSCTAGTAALSRDICWKLGLTQTVTLFTNNTTPNKSSFLQVSPINAIFFKYTVCRCDNGLKYELFIYLYNEINRAA